MLRTPSRLEPAFRIKKKLNSIDSTKLHNPNELKQQLIKEMLDLDKLKQDLESGSTTVDFSMLQTYKEMIQSRRVLLEQIDSSID
jgi:hypothetical protein